MYIYIYIYYTALAGARAERSRRGWGFRVVCGLRLTDTFSGTINKVIRTCFTSPYSNTVSN